MASPDERSPIAFAEKVLALLDQGSFTATYKYAVLLGLIDVCLEGVTRAGRAPEAVTTRQLAEAVVRLYWSQAAPFDGGPALRQNRTGQAEIVTLVARARDRLAGGAAVPLERARHRAPDAFARLVTDVEWKLVEMPLPRLQVFGQAEERFIYEIEWDARIRRRDFLDGARFSNLIRFVGDAGAHLVRLAGLLRPLLQRRWAADVARMNADRLADAHLEDFLFGCDRVALAPVLPGLRDLQADRCFYCDERLRDRDAQVDHFLPWARVPLDAIENLVVADRACNASKRDFLAASSHVERWAARARARAGDLAAIARGAQWEAAPARSLGVARALYLLLPAEARLWAGVGVFEAPEGVRIAGALG